LTFVEQGGADTLSPQKKIRSVSEAIRIIWSRKVGVTTAHPTRGQARPDYALAERLRPRARNPPPWSSAPTLDDCRKPAHSVSKTDSSRAASSDGGLYAIRPCRFCPAISGASFMTSYDYEVGTRSHINLTNASQHIPPAFPNLMGGSTIWRRK